MNREKIVRIGNAGGFWGDDPEALKRQVRGGKLDYITADYLAEITMSILQKQRKSMTAKGREGNTSFIWAKIWRLILNLACQLWTNNPFGTKIEASNYFVDDSTSNIIANLLMKEL